MFFARCHDVTTSRVVLPYLRLAVVAVLGCPNLRFNHHTHVRPLDRLHLKYATLLSTNYYNRHTCLFDALTTTPHALSLAFPAYAIGRCHTALE